MNKKVQKNMINLDSRVEGFKMCDKCHRYHSVDNMRKVKRNGREVYMCINCFELTFQKCDYCGELHDGGSLIKVYGKDNKSYTLICRDCLEKNKDLIIKCYYCCEYHHKVDMIPDSVVSNINRCEKCAKLHNMGSSMPLNGVHSYHHGVNWEIMEDEKDSIRSTFGFELETESEDYHVDELADFIKKQFDFIETERDGSLDDNGIEFISHPFTKKWFNKNINTLISLLNTLSDCGRYSHENGNCGLHIHISRSAFDSNEAIDRFVYLVNKFPIELLKFSRRTASQLEHWAGFYNTSDLTLDYIKNVNKCDTRRYRAVNLQNRKTIEVRIFRGTLNPKTFIATFELVFNLLAYANRGKNVLDATFSDIVNFRQSKFLKEYCGTRNIEIKEVK